jgi:proteasome alpha subunit
MGGQADQVSAVLKDRHTEGMPLSAALAPRSPPRGAGQRETSEINATQLEVAVLVRGRPHRAFRRLSGARLGELLSEGGTPARRPPGKARSATPEPGDQGSDG